MLVGSAFWAGLLDWIRAQMLTQGLISPEDMDLMTVVDTPEQALQAVFAYYEGPDAEAPVRNEGETFYR